MRALGVGTTMLALAFSQTSCSDMLGLGELSYSAGAETVGTGGAAGSGGGPAAGGTAAVTVGSGGAPDEYEAPVTGWAPDSILVAVPPDGTSDRFYRYEPTSQVLHEYRYLSNSFVLESSTPWPSNQDVRLSHVVLAFENGREVLIGYDSAAGWRLKAEVGDDGELLTEVDIVNSGYSHFLTVPWQERWFLVAYDEKSGDYSWVPALMTTGGEPSTPVTSGYGNFGAGWTDVRPFSWDGGEGLLLMKPGKVALYAFPESPVMGMGGSSSGGVGLVPVADLDLHGFSSTPSTVQLVRTGTATSLFFYASDSGLVEVWQLHENQGEWALKRNGDFVASSDATAGKIRKNLTSWVFVSSQSSSLNPVAITFDGKVATDRRFGPGGDDTVIR